jgi:hypothetical protein
VLGSKGGELQIQGQLGLHSETLSQKKKKKICKYYGSSPGLHVKTIQNFESGGSRNNTRSRTLATASHLYTFTHTHTHTHTHTSRSPAFESLRSEPGFTPIATETKPARQGVSRFSHPYFSWYINRRS